MTRFSITQMLRYAALFTAVYACLAHGDPPGLDCSQAANEAEKLVCADNFLSKLDRKLSDLYASVKKNPEQAAKQRTSQKKWLLERDACSKASDLRGCVESSYERRIAEIQIQSGSVTAFASASYNCPNHDRSQPFTAVYYNKTDPPSAVFTNGKDRVIATVQRSGSGARYQAPGVDFWEHQGEAMVVWRGEKFTCKVQR
jgi:uncharacterized protein